MNLDLLIIACFIQETIQSTVVVYVKVIQIVITLFSEVVEGNYTMCVLCNYYYLMLYFTFMQDNNLS